MRGWIFLLMTEPDNLTDGNGPFPDPPCLPVGALEHVDKYYERILQYQEFFETWQKTSLPRFSTEEGDQVN